MGEGINAPPTNPGLSNKTRQVNKVEERVEPSMESKTDYEEWLKAGNDKAKEIVQQINTGKEK